MRFARADGPRSGVLAHDRMRGMLTALHDAVNADVVISPADEQRSTPV
jgi:hypothetical protein